MTGCNHLTLAVLRDVALSWPWEKVGAWKERRERCHWLTDGAGQSTCKGGPVAMITSFLHIWVFSSHTLITAVHYGTLWFRTPLQIAVH